MSLRFFTPYTTCAILFSSTLSAVSGAAHAQPYNIDYSRSAVSFAGVQAGQEFTGTFGEWNAAIDFDPQDLEHSSISATFKTASASTGNVMLDGALPKSDWFAADQFPEAVFTSHTLRADTAQADTYIAEGTLTLRDVTQPVSFTFTLSDLSAAPVQAHAAFTLDRSQFNIGMDSDPKAEWVDKGITVSLDITATPAQR